MAQKPPRVNILDKIKQGDKEIDLTSRPWREWFEWVGTDIVEEDLSLSDVTTANAGTDKHGFLPKLSGETDEYLRGDGTWVTPSNVNIAVLKNVQTSGTDGGTATSGDWYVLVLNTEEDPGSIVTLSSNQFTLAAGTYHVRGEAVNYDADEMKVRLKNVTDTSYHYGLNVYSTPSSLGNVSTVSAAFTITGAKTYQLEYRVGLTNSGDGLGKAMSVGDEVYVMVTITKFG